MTRNTAALAQVSAGQWPEAQLLTYLPVRGPQAPVHYNEPFDCDVWWNEVATAANGQLLAVGPRIAEVVAFGRTRRAAVTRARANICRIRCAGAYYRNDIGETLWPPGMDN